MDHACGGASVYVEVLENIQSVDVFVRGDHQPSQVFVKPRYITTKQANGVENSYELPVNIDPHSVHTVLKHADEGISMKFRMESDDSNTKRMATSIKRYGGEVCHLERGCPSQCGCCMCGMSFFKSNVKFSRVLPLPSSVWTDMLNMWTCCSHIHGTEGEKSPTKKSNAINPAKQIQPREGDCLIGDIFIVVHSKVLDKNNICFRKKKNQKPTPTWDILCARCKSLIGDSEQSPQEDKVAAYKLYKSCVEIVTAAASNKPSTPVETVVSEFFLERILAQQFANSSVTHVTHMLIIQDLEKTVHLLVRVLNHSTSMYTSSGHPFQNECCIEASIKKKTNKYTKDTSPLELINGHAGGDCDENPLCEPAVLPDSTCSKAQTVEHMFSFSNHYFSIAREYCDKISEPKDREKIVKVLYACVDREPGKALYEKWNKDERTQILTYPAEVCHQISLVLMANTLTMPIANRSLNDFAVGFLRSE